MSARFILTLLLSLIVLAVLVALGSWQVSRLGWKQAVLADISARIGAEPVPVPARPDPVRDRYLPVLVDGEFTGEGLRVLVSTRDYGAGYRMLSVLLTADGRRLIVDRGFQPVENHAGADVAGGPVRVLGNLHWPDDLDRWTPPPEPENNLWFARDVGQVSAALKTEPVLIVAREITPPDTATLPLPLSTEAISNRHLEYAFTWFSFAFIWSVMTAVVLWRIRRRTV